MPVSCAANRLGNSASRCVIARMPAEAAGFDATAASRDSIGVDGSVGANISVVVSGTVVPPSGAHPGTTPAPQPPRGIPGPAPRAGRASTPEGHTGGHPALAGTP